MNYLDTAFAQLQFSIKLMHFAESGSLALEQLDVPLTIEEGNSVLVLPDKVFTDPNDLINACQNNVSICFGAAAITLNRCREERGLRLPDPIQSEVDQCVALIYQIRNAFAHDISEPRWYVRARYAREYRVENVRADLQHLDAIPFAYEHIGGPDALFFLKEYAQRNYL